MIKSQHADLQILIRGTFIIMKKFFGLALVACAMMAVSSCTTVVPMAATSNNVGTKCGTASEVRILGLFPFKGDHGINAAAKNGGIQKISHVDVQEDNILFLYVKRTTKVYGE